MTHQLTSYLFEGIHYCGDCIAKVLLDTRPWSAYTATFESGWEPEADLNHIARRFRVDRDDADALTNTGFPRKVTEPPDPPTFCGLCLWWFPTSEKPKPTEGNGMFNDPHIVRHANALLNPADDNEKLLVIAYQLVAKIADAHPHDLVAVKALEHAGSAALILLEHPTGRIDQAQFDKDIRAMVAEAGGDAEEL